MQNLWELKIREYSSTNHIFLYENDQKFHTYGNFLQSVDSLTKRIGKEKQLIEINGINSYNMVVAIFASFIGGHCCVVNINSISSEIQPSMVIDTDGIDIRIRTNKGFNETIDPRIALLVQTSGTAGQKKFVKLTHKNLITNAESIIEYLNIDEKQLGLLPMPLSYAYAISILTSHVLAGAKLYINHNNVRTPAFWNECARVGVTNISGVPAIYEWLYNHSELLEQLDCLDFATQAGGKLDSKLVKYFANHLKQKKAKFFVMYGQTEAAPRISYLPPEQANQHPDSIGIAIPNGKISILDESGKPITEFNKTGELVYEGPNIMAGYAHNMQDLTMCENINTLHTGDIAYKDNKELFYIVGRMDRTIKLDGIRINLDQIESNLRLEFPGEFAVLEDSKRIIIIFTNLENFSLKNSKTIKELKLPGNYFEIKANQNIPLNENGKIDYSQLKKTILSSRNNRYLNIFRENLRDNLHLNRPKKNIEQIFQWIFYDKKITPDSSFHSLGGDSLSQMAMLVEFEKSFGAEPFENWENCSVVQIQNYYSNLEL